MSEQQVHTEEHVHVSHRALYIRVGIILTILTLFEVSMYVFRESLGHHITTPALVIFTIIKFVLVALYFMHLKFDNKLLKILFFFAVGSAIFLMGLMFLDFFGTPMTNDLKLVFPTDIPTF